MSLVAKRRELTRRSIQQSPITIVLTRIPKVPDGAGGYMDGEPVSIGPQTFRLFISSNQSHTIAQEGGQMQVNQWGLLCEYDADIKRDDTFTVSAPDGDRKYRVVKVDPVRLLGEVVSIQAVVEEVVSGGRIG